MKSKVEIRMFAVENAVKVMGVGMPIKDVVGKAKEIEKYVIGDAVGIPEVEDEGALLANVMGVLGSVLRPDDNTMQVMELKKKK